MTSTDIDERTRRYADLIGRLYLTTSDGGCHSIEDIARAVVAAVDAEQDKLRRLIAELSDPDPCWFDHHGGCQAHGYLMLQPGETCPQYDAQQIVAALEARA